MFDEIWCMWIFVRFLISGHFNWSVCCLLEEEGWRDMVEDIFISIVFMAWIFIHWISLIFFSVCFNFQYGCVNFGAGSVVDSQYLDFYLKYLASVAMFYSCWLIFDENSVLESWRSLLYCLIIHVVV